MPRIKICNTCAYYADDGSCRAKAPTRLPEDSIYTTTPWALVSANDWCAKHVNSVEIEKSVVEKSKKDQLENTKNSNEKIQKSVDGKSDGIIRDPVSNEIIHIPQGIPVPEVVVDATVEATKEATDLTKAIVAEEYVDEELPKEESTKIAPKAPKAPTQTKAPAAPAAPKTSNTPINKRAKPPLGKTNRNLKKRK